MDAHTASASVRQGEDHNDHTAGPRHDERRPVAQVRTLAIAADVGDVTRLNAS
jgi:hypothetical protein